MNPERLKELQDEFSEEARCPMYDEIDGMRDCRDGVDHQPGRGSEYDRGYNAQYASEQVITAGSMQ